MRDINRQEKQISARGSASSASASAGIAARLARCALFVVLMAVASFIRIPIPYVPLTFQTVVAILAGLLLGAKWGAAAMLVYTFMGLAGLPVFSGGGGFAYVLQLTFGYIVGFSAAAFAAGLVRGKGSVSLRRAALAALAGVAANYLFGIAHFALIWSFYMNMSGLWKALLVNNLLFLPKDLLLCLLAAVLAQRVGRVIRR